jgi:hypothetical protein
MGKKARKERRQRRERKKSGDNSVKRVMNVLGGSFLVRENFVKQFPFMVTVTVLLMVLITNTYIAESRTREIADNTKTLNDLHVTYIQLKSEIMQASKQSVLTKKLSDIGIKPPMEPVKRINVVENQEIEQEEKK